MTVKLSPVFNGQTITNTGAPASGYKLYTFVAGSSAPLATYTDSTGNAPQTNPIVLNSSGYPTNPIWVLAGMAYKFILKDANDVQVGLPWDNISGVNDTSIATDEWTDSGLTPTYVSTTSYTVSGDQTTALHIGRRQKFTTTAGTVYGRITNSVYNGSTLTAVTLQMDGSQVLDGGLSVVQNSIQRANVLSDPVRAATASGTDTYTATVGIARLVKDDQYQIKIANTNASTTPTLNLDSTGAKTIVNIDGSALYPGALNGEHLFRYDGTNMVLLNPTKGASFAGPVLGAFRNLAASATGSSANVSVSADEIVVENSSNAYKTLRNVSLTIAGTANGANGLDAGTIAASTWYSVWVIAKEDGTKAGLLSTSAAAPTLPTDYIYKARIGWIRTDGTANKYPLAFKQFGRNVRYVVGAGTNVTALPQMANGAAGSATIPTWVSVATANYVPSTAAKIAVMMNDSANTGAQRMAAPNNSYGAITSSTNPPPLVLNAAAAGSAVVGDFVLESANIYWASVSGTGSLWCLGWEDNL